MTTFTEALETVIAEVQAEYDNPPLSHPAVTEEMSKDEIVAHLRRYHVERGYRELRVSGHLVTPRGTKATKHDLIAWHDRAHQNETIEAVRVRVDQVDPRGERDYYEDHAGWVEVKFDTLDASEEERRKAAGLGVPGLQHFLQVVRQPPVDGTYSMWVHLMNRHEGRRDSFLPPIPHSHDPVVVPEDLAGLAEAITEAPDNKPVTSKPLSATERKLLSQVLDNDFANLKARMKSMADASLEARQREINADWDAKEARVPDLAGEATTLRRAQQDEARELRRKHEEAMAKMLERHQDAMAKVTAKADQAGVQLVEVQEEYVNEVGQRATRPVLKSEVIGRKEALEAANKDVKRMLSQALLELEQQRLNAQRKVLVSGITQEAAKILDTIPAADQMMLDAQAQKTAREIESGKS